MWQSFLDSTLYNTVFTIGLVCAVGAGILFAIQFKKKKIWESTGVESAVIGIFGLIISFTFLQSGNAHRERSVFIHDESSAVDRLFRYSKQMPDSFALQTKTMLINFLDNQFSFNKKQLDNGKLVSDNGGKILSNYWNYLTQYRNQHTSPIVTVQLDKINGAFDNLKYSTTRHAFSFAERTPAVVMLLLTITSMLIGFLVGFMSGVKKNIHYLVAVIYVVIISMVMMVIRDLNDPFRGLIQPDYLDLRHNYEIIKN